MYGRANAEGLNNVIVLAGGGEAELLLWQPLAPVGHEGARMIVIATYAVPCERGPLRAGPQCLPSFVLGARCTAHSSQLQLAQLDLQLACNEGLSGREAY